MGVAAWLTGSGGVILLGACLMLTLTALTYLSWQWYRVGRHLDVINQHQVFEYRRELVDHKREVRSALEETLYATRETHFAIRDVLQNEERRLVAEQRRLLADVSRVKWPRFYECSVMDNASDRLAVIEVVPAVTAQQAVGDIRSSSDVEIVQTFDRIQASLDLPNVPILSGRPGLMPAVLDALIELTESGRQAWTYEGWDVVWRRTVSNDREWWSGSAFSGSLAHAYIVPFERSPLAGESLSTLAQDGYAVVAFVANHPMVVIEAAGATVAVRIVRRWGAAVTDIGDEAIRYYLPRILRLPSARQSSRRRTSSSD